jgi:hypothetical protein
MRSSRPNRFVVRMLKSHGIWSEGETPTFDETDTERLVAIGAAEVIGKHGEVDAAAADARPPPPPPDLKVQLLAGTHTEAKSMEKPKPSRRGNRRDHAPANIRSDDATEE